jgi:hypothetical protein
MMHKLTEMTETAAGIFIAASVPAQLEDATDTALRAGQEHSAMQIGRRILQSVCFGSGPESVAKRSANHTEYITAKEAKTREERRYCRE